MKKIIYADYALGTGCVPDKFYLGTFDNGEFQQRVIKDINTTSQAATYIFNMMFAYDFKITLLLDKTGVGASVLDNLLGLLRKEKYDIDLKTGHVIAYNPLKEQVEKINVFLNEVADMFKGKDILTVDEANVLYSIDNLKTKLAKL